MKNKKGEWRKKETNKQRKKQKQKETMEHLLAGQNTQHPYIKTFFICVPYSIFCLSLSLSLSENVFFLRLCLFFCFCFLFFWFLNVTHLNKVTVTINWAAATQHLSPHKHLVAKQV